LSVERLLFGSVKGVKFRFKRLELVVWILGSGLRMYTSAQIYGRVLGGCGFLFEAPL
jgi:hypothetical protein